jgi:hypothetical protein
MHVRDNLASSRSLPPAADHELCVRVVGSKHVELIAKGKSRQFAFDQVMPQETSQVRGRHPGLCSAACAPVECCM